MKRWFKVYLLNMQTLGAMCGYGEGRTMEAAIECDLLKARQRDPSAYYDGQHVCFSGGINC